MTDKTKKVLKKIGEIVIYLLVGAAAAAGVINFDKITDAFKAGETAKIEQSTQMYATDTVVKAEVKAVAEKAKADTKADVKVEAKK